MSKLLITEIITWACDYPVNGDYLATATKHSATGQLWRII
jgi:hypothetical protein